MISYKRVRVIALYGYKNRISPKAFGKDQSHLENIFFIFWRLMISGIKSNQCKNRLSLGFTSDLLSSVANINLKS